MLSIAFWCMVASFVAMKIVDWKGKDFLSDPTYWRTRMFGLFVLLALATVGLVVWEWVIPMMFGPRL